MQFKRAKWWNNGWIGILVLLCAYAVFFVVGRNSPAYAPDPVYEGRRLSEWTGDLENHDASALPHSKAVEVLKAHQVAIRPILVRWLDERNSIPEVVYIASMQTVEGKHWNLLHYYGAHMNHGYAANALRVLGDRDPGLIAALERTKAHYDGKSFFVEEELTRAIEELKGR